MSGQPTFFYTYEARGTEHETFNWFATQALADAGAASAGRLANVGAVEIPNGWATGWIRNPADGAWRLLGASDLDEVGQRRYAAGELYEALDGQEHEIGQRMGLPSKVAGRVRDVLAYARWAAFSIFTSGTYTAAQQIAWATAMLAGPSDAADLDTLIQKSSALTDDEVPGGSAAWVSPVDVSISTLGGSKADSARWNAAIGDLTTFNPGNGAWIEELT